MNNFRSQTTQKEVQNSEVEIVNQNHHRTASQHCVSGRNTLTFITMTVRMCLVRSIVEHPMHIPTSLVVSPAEVSKTTSNTFHFTNRKYFDSSLPNVIPLLPSSWTTSHCRTPLNRLNPNASCVSLTQVIKSVC